MWLTSRHYTGLAQDIIIERTADAAFVYLVAAADMSQQPQPVTSKFMIYPKDGRSYWVSFLLVDSSNKEYTNRTGHISEMHVDCTVPGQRS